MNTTFKKIMSILLCCVMLFGMIPRNAYAVEDQGNAAGSKAVNSVVNGAYGEDGVWEQGGTGSVTHDVNGTDVTLSKTAVPVEGMDNTYDITLQVRTSTSVSVKTTSGAVVLVIDTSSSMKSCAECGGRNEHNKSCKYGSGDVSNSENRLTAAKAAAREFLASYSGTDAGASRMLAIVTFDGGYRTNLSWSNVAGGAGQNSYDKALSTINGLGTNTGTNMEGGLYEALGLLDDSEVSSVSAKNVVLLSDGAPTSRISNSQVSQSKANCDAAANQARAIRNTGAKLYTVCFGAARDKTYDNGPTVSEFLRGSIASGSDYAYDADNSAQLAAAFKSITESINSGMSGEGWTTTDPMASNVDVVAGAGVSFYEDGEAYTWELSDVTTTVEGNTTYYVYSYTYRITFNPQFKGFEEGDYYPTNQRTYLNIEGKQYEFPVPGVTAKLPRTDVSVTKVWDDRNNQDGIRPEAVTVQLKEGSRTIGDPVVLSEDNGWSHTWDGMKYDLIAKSEGEVHVYTVEEVEVPEGYTSDVVTNGYAITVTNSYTPEVVAVAGVKTWNDNENQDGIRPEFITINLLADGEVIDTVTVTAEDKWAWNFENLPKYKDHGTEIVYSITEDAVEAYSTEYDGYNVINSYVPAKTSVTVSKAWNDNENQDGIRPESVTVKLLANGVDTGRTLVLSQDNGWTGSFTELDKYQGGKEVEYSVAEVTVPGYETEINGNAAEGYTITNSHTPATVKVEGTKTWVDNDNQDGVRPESITINLLADGEIIKTVTVTAEDNWAWSFEGLPQYKDHGTAIVYSVTEDAVEDYSTTYNGYDVTNTHTPEQTSVTVSKIWNDSNDQDGIRPDSVTVKLLANGVDTGKTLELNADNRWTGSFTELDKFQGGKEVEYSVAEVTVPGYETEINGNAAEGYTITNSHAPETVAVKGTKTWEDNDDQDGIRPESITINLLADGEVIDTVTVTAANNWTWSYTGLPKYKDHGTEIVYSITENPVDGYTTTYNGYNVINSHTPEVISVEGAKTWNDNDNQDNIRPDSITIQLLADGVVIDTVTVTADTDWTWSFENLPKNNAGREIVYTIGENPVSGYTVSYDGFNVTNTHIPEQTSVNVTKVWQDNNDQDGIRPNDITVKLLANGEDTGKTLVLSQGNGWTGSFTELDKFQSGKAVEYSVAEVTVPGYETDINGNAAEGYTITNSHTPATVKVEGTKTWVDNDNQDGVRPESITINLLADGEIIKTVTVTAEDNWAWSFEGLPQYKDHGTAIVYSVTEDAVEDYSTTYNGYDVTNTHTPEQTSVTVTKVWQDSNDQDGIRPNDITVKLLANGQDTGKTLVLSQGNGWTGSFTELDKFQSGKAVEYSVAEVTVPGYETVITGTAASGFTVTNSHTPATVKVEGTKTWVDNDNQDGVRPESITINLLADGEIIKTVTVTAEDNWAWSFEGLPQYKDHGTAIVYSVTEDAVEDYSTTYNGYDVTNTHTPEQTSVTVTKVWQDSNDQDGIRPNDITVKLLANGQDTGKTLVLSQGNGWTGSFTELDKFQSGKAVEYSVAEVTVPGYETVITGTAASGFTVTNSHTPATVKVEGTKTWVDNDNQDGVRPESITINLLADGEIIKTVTVTAEDNWAWSFEGLPQYKDHGTAIVYSVTEDAVEDYSTTYNGYDVTNTHTPEQTSVTVTKVWQDSNDQDGIRPNDITVKLLANGQDTGKTLVLSQGNGWTGSFTELDKFQSGKEVEYSVAEVTVPGYETVITGTAASGFTVTNSHTPATVKVEGTKTWVDNDNQDGVRPESITINLLADGEIIKTVTVTAEDNWAWSFEGLPQYKDHGTAIVYSITENRVEDYSTEYNGYNVTNTRTPAKTSVTVTKVWQDNNNQDGIRPNSVTVKLLANGRDTGKTLVLSQGNGWTGSFTELDKFKRGQEIVYSVEEVTVAGYASVITGTSASGYTITNTHVPAVVNIPGVKIWVDNYNQDGIRPESITIKLLADGVVVGTKTVTAADGWAWNFTNLPQYKNNGTPIIYAVIEERVDGYFTVYNGYSIINTHAPEQTSVTVTKAWQDNDDQDGIRPNDVTVKLLANGQDTGKTLVLSQGNNWTGSFTELDKFYNGEEIVYTVEEILVDGYNSIMTGTAADGFTITNSHTPATVKVEGTKTWVDNDDQDGARPESITINLVADGEVIKTVTVTAEDNWAWSFEGLPQYKDHGTAIVYAITENAVEDYSTEYDGYNVINTHAPEETSVTVTKVWQDNNDQDGIRPEEIVVVLVADGHKTLKTLKLNAENNWTGSFTELDKFKRGEEIVYTVEEKSVKGYESVVSGDAAIGFTVTNTHNPETVDVAGSKTWKDHNNQDGARPESITVHLLKNGQVIDTKVVTEADGWAWSFTDLPKYENGGSLITYAISEDAVENYSTEYKGYDIVNTHTPEQISITVTKTWADSNDAAGLRPNKVTIVLYANGEKTSQKLKLSKSNNWTDTFTGLDKYKDGEEIVYTVKEIAVEGYNTVIRGDMKSGFQVTNSRTYIPQTGDDRNPALWISMITVALFAMAGVAVYPAMVPQRRKRRN